MAQPSVINSTNEQIPCDPTGDVSDESDTQSEVTSRPTTPNLPDPVEQNGRDGESENDQSPAGPADGTMAIGCGQVLRVQLISSPSKLPTPAPKQIEHPQEKISKLWKNFEPEYQGKVTRVLPDLLANQTDVQKASLERQQSQKAAKSYEEARAECVRAVERIKRECEEQNVRFSDPHFDIEEDLKISGRRDCLRGLVPDGCSSSIPGDVKRVQEIFKKPRFFKDEESCDDVVQGTNADCWFLSALSVLKSNHELLKKVCVIQAPTIGVYGFVFHRDGEWHQCIIDDKLYLRAPAYDEHGVDVLGSWNVVQKEPEDEYERLFQTGSKALQFAQCSNSDETWVPLLEKAYAKAHGDFEAINAGQTGEALEDLTGGVTTEIYTTNILDKDQFWEKELSKVGDEYLFSCGLACYRNWRQNLDDKSERALMERAVQEKRLSGLLGSHAYAILATYSGYGKRLIKIRNPWGHTGWKGPWSDGSKEWTDGDGEWLRRLKYKFGDDGVFWMDYNDFLRKFKYIDKTRLFGPEWHLAAAWTSVQVPFSSPGYLDTKFSIKVNSATPTVIVLSQLDDRYFRGLEGKYDYKLQFRVQKDGVEDPNDYVARSRLNYELIRSVNVEIDLEANSTYTVLIKVEAYKNGREDVEAVIQNNIRRREKVTQIGMSYDLAHQKGLSSKSHNGRSVQTSTGQKSPAKSDSKDDDPDRDPWNACCVVGLKVYSKLPDLSVNAVLPNDESDSDGKEEDVNVVLDGEDPAKAALDQVTTNSTVTKDELKDDTSDHSEKHKQKEVKTDKDQERGTIDKDEGTGNEKEEKKNDNNEKQPVLKDEGSQVEKESEPCNPKTSGLLEKKVNSTASKDSKITQYFSKKRQDKPTPGKSQREQNVKDTLVVDEDDKRPSGEPAKPDNTTISTSGHSTPAILTPCSSESGRSPTRSVIDTDHTSAPNGDQGSPEVQPENKQATCEIKVSSSEDTGRQPNASDTTTEIPPSEKTMIVIDYSQS